MYLLYSNLVHFSTQPAFGTMSEAKLKDRVLAWVGNAQDVIDSSYYFTVDYSYNEFGLAVDATIKVQRLESGVWVTLGVYSPSGQSLTSIISTSTCEAVCVPSDIPSQPIHYYVPNYYASGYYV